MTDMNILFVASVVHEKLLIEILKTQPRYYGIQGQYFMRLMLLGLKANGVKVNVLSNNLAYRYWHSKRGERHCVLEDIRNSMQLQNTIYLFSYCPFSLWFL